ncbi:hypothetical protein [Mesorhizobium sp.]|uniref:hypothetical protein n=1 Tax=Mesorhizobium sp. TaxID=1871066 RepID=UPI000FE9AEE8|nr:hypothetical protein [Mesorhizobium sp.]RWF66883.1 MAG: hypothetical protein EOS47_04675 [Mesorhizobium sp.]TIT42344.1 MAG: hypothetical protein E5W76_10890 [Mesorhizobium sp.]
MADYFNGHINRDAFEKVLRETFAAIPIDASTHPVLRCQARSTEVQVQFALYIADELNAGTSAEVLLDAGSRVIGGMVENFARGFASDDPREDLIASILDRVRWATSQDDDDCVVEVRRPQTLGGKA